MGQFTDKFLQLDEESVTLQTELQDIAQRLADLETMRWKTEEQKYHKLEDGTLKALTTIQAELVEAVSSSYDAEGKTKDERAANLLRYVKDNYPEYNKFEQRIQEAEYNLRSIKSEMTGLESLSKAKMKALSAVQARIEVVGKIIEALSRSQQSASFSEMERRRSEK